MKTIEQLEAGMLTLKKQIEELKNTPTFEAGKWYYIQTKGYNKVYEWLHLFKEFQEKAAKIAKDNGFNFLGKAIGFLIIESSFITTSSGVSQDI
jgi:hypothetical protein